MHKILLSGYYGYNNAGDEAILKSIIANIRKIDVDAQITVLSDNIRFTKEKYGINAVKRFNPFHILSALLSCDILISGGGTLFQDKTSTRSLVYYTSIIYLARLFGKKVMIYANGIGPLKNKKNIERVKKSIEKSDMVTLRDIEAFDLVKSMNVKNKNIFMTTDPVFSLESESKENIDNILNINNVPCNKDFIVVSVRTWERMQEFTDIFADLCDYIIEKYNKNILFFALQYPHDLESSKIIQEKMKSKSYLIEDISPMQMMGIMERASYVISMRLHGLIFASSVSTPVLGFSYDPKIDNLLHQIEMPMCSNIQDMNIEDMKVSVDDMEINLSSYKEKLEKNVKHIKEMAQNNYDYMKMIIEK